MKDDLRIRFLIVDDEQSIRKLCMTIGNSLGFQCMESESAEAAVERLEGEAPDIVMADLKLPQMSGIELLKHVKSVLPRTEVAIMTGHGSVESAVTAMKLGAYDYIEKPFRVEALRLFLQRMADKVRLVAENEFLRERVNAQQEFSGIVGTSAKIQDVLRIAARLRDTRTPVLITGESGTGKELVARAIHYGGSLASMPFVAVDCGSLVPTLMESELFGYEKGAFTGAMKSKRGLFQSANGGTIFLDEIGELPQEMQAKLLRVLQEKQFERIGGNQPFNVDVRIIAATNQDLEAMIAQGKFREDLYYRLKVVEIRVPAVRERREDVPLMVQHFIADACQRFSTPEKQLSPEAMRACVEAPWKGNARSLKAAIEQAVILSPGVEITPADLFSSSEPETDHAAPASSSTTNHAPAANDSGGESALTFREAKEKFVGDWERDFFVRALRATGGNISRAAERTGMYRQSFQQKMRELGITLADIGLAPKNDGN
jgi:DNA-binding NtrC family response regulator